MPTYAELNQKHPSIDLDQVADYQALYDGGKAFKARLPRFLPQWECEPNTRYDLRKKIAHYRNYLGAVINYFAALLFAGKAVAVAKTAGGAEVKDPDPYYGKFRGDCDGNGKDLELFFKERLTEAMTHRCAWFAIEQPRDTAATPPRSRAEYRQRKLGDSKLCPIPVGDVFDWECDDDGRLEWVLVHSKKAKRAETLVGGRSRTAERWKMFLPDRVVVFGVDYESSSPPANDAVIPVIDAEGYPHRFGTVPVVCMELPKALWAADALETPQLAHFRASNAQTFSLANSAFAMMLFQVADPAEFSKAKLGPGKGIALGIEEKASWLAPPSQHFSALDVEVKAQKDEIFRLAHQMALGVENNATAVGRSGESKAADSESTRTILEAYGEVVVETMERVFDMISAVRGDEFDWSIDGLGDFASADIGGLMTTLESVDKIGGIPSITWRSKILTKVANTTAPDLTQDEKDAIAKEILESLEENREMDLAMREAQLNGDGETTDDEQGTDAGGARGNSKAAPPRGQATAAS